MNSVKRELRSEPENKKHSFGERCISALASGRAISGISRRGCYEESDRSKAIVIVDAILQRGNAAQMVEVRGIFRVTELVVS